MHVVDWLNQNQGFVMSVLTLVYVIATIVIVYYNRKSIQEMKNARESESRPYVFAYLNKDPRDLCFYLRIKNYGKSGAKIDDIQVEPNLKFVECSEVQNFLNNVILAPEQMLQFIVLEKKDETIKNDYKVKIAYSSVFGATKKYSEEYTLVIQYAHQMGYTDSKTSNLSDEANALKNIAAYLDSIRSKM